MNSFQQSELNRQFNALFIFGVVSQVDYANKQLKLKDGAQETGWIPFPAKSGRNWKAWHPVKQGQQFVAICPNGDSSQAQVVGELWWEDNDSPSTDENIDLIAFSNGAVISYDVTTGVLDLRGFSDVLVNGISIPFHVHCDVEKGQDITGGPE